jgi:hypothetical protein
MPGTIISWVVGVLLIIILVVVLLIVLGKLG